MSVHFTKLNQEEVERKLIAFKNSESYMTIWKKGKKERGIFKALDIKNDPIQLTIKGGESSLEGGEVLAHFSLNSLSFFFKSNIEKKGSNYLLSEIKEFVKAERRTSFRLLTYPHKKVFLKFTLDNLPEKKSENLVSIETGTSETGLFINFLDLLNQSVEEPQSLSDLKLRVQDLSSTGLCFEVGALEKEYLEKNKTLKDVELNFEEVTLTIPKMSIVYIKKHKNFLSDIQVYRVGVEFHELDDATERLLSKKINDYIYQLEKKFEDSID